MEKNIEVANICDNAEGIAARTLSTEGSIESKRDSKIHTISVSAETKAIMPEAIKKPEGKEEKEVEASIKKLSAIEGVNHYTRTSMKVEKHLSLVRRAEAFQAVCSYTGIVIDISIPKIDGLVLEYVNPLSYWENVKGIIEQGESYLDKLELQILAGLWITAYKHWELIDPSSAKMNSSLLNAMLRTAGKDVLITSLLMAGHLNKRFANRCGRFDVAYEAHKEAANMSASIQEYTRAVRDSVFPPEKLKISAEEAAIDAKWSTKASSVRTSGKHGHKITTVQEQFEDKFKADKKEGKFLLKELEELMILPIPFVSILKTVFQDKNLVGLDSGLRAKIVAKLRSYGNMQASKMAKIIEEGNNPYDIFSDVATALESKSVEVAVAATNRKRSLAEILADKRAAKEREVKEHFAEEQNKLGSAEGKMPESIDNEIEDDEDSEDEGSDF